MQSFTKQELAWTAQEIARAAERMELASEMPGATEIERGLYRLRAEQFQIIAEKLNKAITNGDRRIEIR